MRRIFIAGLVAAITAVAAMTPATASVVTGVKPACGLNQRITQTASGGIQVLSRPNPFNTTHTFCIRPRGQVGYTVMNNLSWNGRVRAFPFSGVGCAYDLCSARTDLPKQVSRLAYNANMSWDWSGISSGYWNASYDLWFSKTNQITSQDNGAELMIWLRTPPGYAGGHLVNVPHAGRFWLMHWKACNSGICWNYIQFRFLRTVHGARLRMRPFIRYAESLGLIQPRWYLTSVHAGYEIWSGGKGLQTDWFNAHV